MAVVLADNVGLVEADGLDMLSVVSLTISTNPALEVLSLPALERVEQTFVVSNNAALTELAVPKLIAGGGWVIAGNAELSTVNASSLTSIDSWTITGNPSLTSLGDLSLLTSVGQLTIADNASFPQCLADELDERLGACSPCIDNDDSAVCD
jgi:hypothetical protein